MGGGCWPAVRCCHRRHLVPARCQGSAADGQARRQLQAAAASTILLLGSREAVHINLLHKPCLGCWRVLAVEVVTGLSLHLTSAPPPVPYRRLPSSCQTRPACSSAAQPRRS